MRIALFLLISLIVPLASAWGKDVQHEGPSAGLPAGEQAQENGHGHCHSMPGVEAAEPSKTDPFLDQLEQHLTAGTDAEPSSARYPMLMAERGGWSFMFHGLAFLNALQESGPRGHNQIFSTNWFMSMAQHRLANGSLSLRAMLSFEPATVRQRYYPELFQQGETAFGRAIVDGQHPHDFLMELAVLYDHRFGERTMVSFYAAPVGDPALGPMAYPHRSSASEDPVAPLGHHLEDSTHIADDVITLGVAYRRIRLEASGFHGREPDERRWDLDSGMIDSWSVRSSANPGRNWSVQYSVGQLHSPEALNPGEDIRRMTASLMYGRPMRNGYWSSTLLWGRNQMLATGSRGNAYLVESTIQFAVKNHAWTRIENVDRTNQLLVRANAPALPFAERYFARVPAYTAGYDRQVARRWQFQMAIGGQLTWYGLPGVLKPVYGSHPLSGVLFLRVRLGKN